MRKLCKALPVFLLTLVFAWVTSTVSAPAGYLMPAGQSTEEPMAQGELLKVDTDHQTFTIKLDNGEEVQFQYSSNTKVEGSQNGVQGLSSASGTRLIVYYKDQSGQKIATRIEIKDKK